MFINIYKYLYYISYGGNKMLNKTFVYIKIDIPTDIESEIKLIKDYCKENKIFLKDENIFIDKCIEGKQIKLDSTQALKNLSLNSGDIFIIKELNQLGSTIEGIKNVWEALYMHGVDIIIIENKLLNTYNKSLIERKLKSEIIIELLNYINENMDIIYYNEKTHKSSSIGRPKEDIETLTDEQIQLLQENFPKFDKDRSERTITADQFMSILGLERNTFYKIIKQYKKALGE